MSMSGPGGSGGRDLGAQRWGAEHEELEHQAQQEHWHTRLSASTQKRQPSSATGREEATLVEVLGKGRVKGVQGSSKPNTVAAFQGDPPARPPKLTPSIVAGVALAALGIPEVMGYAKIAEMPVITRL